jgi:hypothetical protein
LSVTATTLLEIPALRQSAEGLFCLDFSCFVLCVKTKNEVGPGAKPLLHVLFKKEQVNPKSEFLYLQAGAWNYNSGAGRSLRRTESALEMCNSAYMKENNYVCHGK